MFRRKEDDEIASQPQANAANSAQSQDSANSATQTSPFGASASATTAQFGQTPPPKPAATQSFGSFSTGPVADNKPVTAPLTTQQVGLGTSGVVPNAPTQNITPKPASAAAPAQGLSQNPGAAFAPSYNKIPAPTASPAAIPAAAQPANSAQPSGKIEGVEAERRLTVGYGITLTGEVSDCDRLVIYGKVNAKLANVKFLQISDSGKFNGSATIDQAEISGVFEGELKVANNITITSTGRVNGKITYGSIEIRPGGKFTGEIVEDTSGQQASGQSSSSESSKDYYGLNSGASATTSEAA